MIAVDISANLLVTNNCFPNTKTLNEIPQLDLGECKGKVKPVPFTPTNTHGFSESQFFSKSDEFTYSSLFSKSDWFSKSVAFSESNDFTDSNKFKASKQFTKSEKFSTSNCFTESLNFIETPAGGNVGLIAGVTVGSVGAVVAAALAAFFIIKKKSIPQINDLETLDENEASITNANPLYGKGEDDPFKDDFIQ